MVKGHDAVPSSAASGVASPQTLEAFGGLEAGLQPPEARWSGGGP